MSDSSCLLALDQGTTSTRAIVFDIQGRARVRVQRELPQHYPDDGWVEHDATDLLEHSLAVIKAALSQAQALGLEPQALGITNQRETTLLWERDTGRALHPAIVWQDRRTADRCGALRAAGHEPRVREITGLLIDPYFSASKIDWMLDHVPQGRARARRGELAFGTVDSWLIWHLTGGRHVTDATNASRTLLFDLRGQRWSEEMLALFDLPASLLPEVLDSAGDFGLCLPSRIDRSLPIRGVAGDQQAALIGQGCLRPGSLKCTFGTGAFAMLNTGPTVVASRHQLLSTLAWRLRGEPAFALEGAIFVAGAALQWLRDGIGLIADAADSERLARTADPDQAVYLVPAFTGLGAPWWDAQARGALFGLTRDTGIADIARAALDAVCHQTDDLLHAMTADLGRPIAELRVDGGMTANDWFLQRLSDLTGVAVARAQMSEATALGAARLAGVGCGLWPTLEAACDRLGPDRNFSPRLSATQRASRRAGWLEAVRRTRSDEASTPGA